jgi:hypothetical protein
MGIATHLGPWLLGTVKNTTGTTAGLVRNTGATIVAQTKTVSFGDTAGTVAFSLPAGALVTAVQLVTPTTAFGAGTITINIGGAAYATTFTLPTALGVTAVTASTTGGAAVSVGSTDALVTYTLASATLGTSTLVMAYMVRNPDGSVAPTAFTA